MRKSVGGGVELLTWMLLVTLSLVRCGSDYSKGPETSQESLLKEVPNRISIKLLTFNVQSRPVLDFQRARVHLPIIASKVARFDIVQVQECFAQCDLFLDRAPHGEKYYFDQRKDWYSLANSGLATLTYRPMEGVIPYFFEAKAEVADLVASKGVLLTRMIIQGIVTDVYATHMQAGSSPSAQVARSRQMRELVTFVNLHSPPSHQVIISGDFNMGPRRGAKLWHDYKPNHYQSQNDMLVRTAIFDELMAALKLSDVSDQLFGPIHDHIERVLYRSAPQGRLTPQLWEDLSAEFLNGHGQRLSDSMPLAVEFFAEFSSDQRSMK